MPSLKPNSFRNLSASKRFVDMAFHYTIAEYNSSSNASENFGKSYRRRPKTKSTKAPRANANAHAHAHAHAVSQLPKRLSFQQRTMPTLPNGYRTTTSSLTTTTTTMTEKLHAAARSPEYTEQSFRRNFVILGTIYAYDFSKSCSFTSK